MQYCFLLVCFIQVITFSTNAQIKQGTVIYDKTTTATATKYINGGPTSTVVSTEVESFQLSFAGTGSVWEPLPEIRKSAGSSDNVVPLSVNVTDIKSSTGDNSLYNDHNAGLTFTKRELGGRNYVVMDSIAILKWKLTGETKKILDFAVEKAIAKRTFRYPVTVMENGKLKKYEQTETKDVIAWFAKDIPFSTGPEVAGLPGLILQLEYADGSVVYKAVEFTKKVNSKNIKMPKGGQVVSMQEFQERVQKLLK